MTRLKLETRTRDTAQVDVEAQMSAYLERLLEYPVERVLGVLRDWPKKSEWWPSWHELAEELGPVTSNVVALPPPRRHPRDQGLLGDRVKRMGLHDARAWSTIGVTNWGHLVEQHHRMTDGELEAACVQLARQHHTQFRSIA